VQTREYAMKLTLYILIGSVVAGGVIAMVITGLLYDAAGAQVLEAARGTIVPADAQPFSFDMQQITLAAENGAFSLPYLGDISFARMWFPFIFLGFGVLAGVFPFHNWSPDGHVAAPTAVSMIHAGVW
jgi:NADH-quinone oxidoreductase subunit M